MKKVLVLLCSLLATSHVFAQLSITAVSPEQADPGTTGLTVTFTLPNSTPPTPPVQISPDSVMIGSLVGTSVNRPSLDTITAVFDIPASEAVGTKDCAVTFTTPQGTAVFSKTGGFTVGTAAGGDAYTNGPPSSGYNLFSPISSTNTYLMDNDENIIKTWTSSYNPGHSVYLLDDGTLMRTAATESTDFSGGGASGRVEQYDWDGNLTWAYDYDTTDYRSHHDVEVLPNGNVLMIAWEKKTQTEAENAGRNPTLIDDGELWPDHVIEVNSSGEIVWEWHVWDHLIQDYSSSGANYGVVADHPEKIDLNYVQSGANDGAADWNHCNAIDYNAELDQILISARNFSEIWVIDHATTTAEAAGSAGDLLYRWGNPDAYGASGDQQLFVQHDAHWIDAGLPGENNILIFNNGKGRSDGDYSSVDEIVPPLAADGSYTNGLPLAPVWTYTNSVATNFYASHISGAQRLKNGNTLICEGTEGYVFEVTSDGGLVWDYTDSVTLFRFERYAPDFEGLQTTELALPTVSYAVVDTAQTACYDNASEISAPATNEAFYGQDAQFDGHQPCYEISPDRKTVYDYNTRLTWTQSPDWTGDGIIDINDKMTQSEAAAYVDTVNAANFGGYSDWRLPTIKEVYSLMDFRGTDPMSDDTSTLVPFINSDYFAFAWGDTDAEERTIDSQVATSTIHIDPVMGGNVDAMPGINIVDGRIKGYPVTKDFLVYLCRGNTNYGENAFADNGDGTVSDSATGLMWAQDDSGSAMLWSNALAYVQQMNASNHLGHSDWRLPNAKEMQSIVDYSRAPGATGSAAIDPILNCTQITNEGGVVDWPWYFTGTTHAKQDESGSSAVYICFGRAIGYWNNAWDDVHGPGAQRSDSKTVNTTGYTYVSDGWYFTESPQGDATRWYNYVRLVRDVELTAVDDYDYGDAPSPYPVTEAEDGARHIATGPMIGTLRDSEINGVHSSSADADDTDGTDDEDGISWDDEIWAGKQDTYARVTVSDAPSGAKLDAWIDFNGDGNWGGPGEQIADSMAVTNGLNMLYFDVPSWAKDNLVYTRFRLSTAGDLGHSGAASDGEVQDQRLYFSSPKSGPGTFAGTAVSTNVGGAVSVVAVDMDGDGDMDVVSAGQVYDAVYWHENDGSQSFTQHEVATNLADVQVVFAVDIDGDGDIDVLSAENVAKTVTWHENDGSQNFTSHTIGTNRDGLCAVFAVDIDGDGDMDILSASRWDDTVVLYENDGSEGFTLQEITTSAAGAAAVCAADVDSDGDMDILVGSRDDDTVAWYENDGSESFMEHKIATNADWVISVCAADVDEDGDMDVLSASCFDNTVAWYENDGSESFTKHAITTNAGGVGYVYAVDVDGDGDVDALSATWDDLIASWYENDGSENFTKHDIGAGDGSVFAADMDGDGDLDVLSTMWDDFTVFWYEQRDTTPDPDSDLDGDGMTYEDEIFVGSDPDDPNSVFKVSVASDGSGDMQLSWPVFKSGWFYDLYGCTNLVSGDWIYLGGTTASNLLNSTTNDAMYYRIEVIDPASMY